MRFYIKKKLQDILKPKHLYITYIYLYIQIYTKNDKLKQKGFNWN